MERKIAPVLFFIFSSYLDPITSRLTDPTSPNRDVEKSRETARDMRI